MDIELEDLNEFRFYKLRIQWKGRCDNYIENVYDFKDKLPRKCGGILKMYRNNGTITEKCFHTDCLKEYEITRVCSYCGRKHEFEDITCDKCENKVINMTSMSVTIEECSKAIKKINRQYKQNLINEEDWKTALNINQEEKEKCLKNLEKLKSEIGLTI